MYLCEPSQEGVFLDNSHAKYAYSSKVAKLVKVLSPHLKEFHWVYNKLATLLFGCHFSISLPNTQTGF